MNDTAMKARTNRRPLVPDLLAPGLNLVFCGTAPSRASAAAKAYYANPGNQFWAVLHRVGFTPRRFAPTEYRQLLTLGIGLTDLCKGHSGNDDELPSDGFDVAALTRKLRRHRPSIVAFTSKTSAGIALGRPVEYGWQSDVISEAKVYVCCSTSGRARRFWREEVWEQLAQALRTR